MPNLPGSTVKGDMEMFDRVLNDPDLQADQWKVRRLRALLPQGRKVWRRR